MGGDPELVALRKLNTELIKKIASLRQQAGTVVSVTEGHSKEEREENGIELADEGSAKVAEMPQEAPLTPPIPAEGRVQNRGPTCPETANIFKHVHPAQPAQPQSPDDCAGCSSCLLNSGLDNFRKRLSWVVDKLATVGGGGTWEHIRSMEAKLEVVVPADGSVGRKELRQLKGARVQEMVVVLQSIAKEVRACKQSLENDGPMVMEDVRSEVFDALLGVESLIDHRRQELRGLNEAGRQIRDLGLTLEGMEEERDVALQQRDELQARLEGLLSATQCSPTSVSGEKKVSTAKRDLRLEKINRLEKELVAAESRLVNVRIQVGDPEQVSCLHTEIVELMQRNLELEEQLKEYKEAMCRQQVEMGDADRSHRLALVEKQKELSNIQKKLLEVESCSTNLLPGLATRLPEAVVDYGEGMAGQEPVMAGAPNGMDERMCQCDLESNPALGDVRKGKESLGGVSGERDLNHVQSYLSNAIGALNSLAQEMRFLGAPPKEPCQCVGNGDAGPCMQLLGNERKRGLLGDTSAGAHHHMLSREPEAGDAKKDSKLPSTRCSKASSRLAHGQHLWWAIALGGSAMAARLFFTAFRQR